MRTLLLLVVIGLPAMASADSQSRCDPARGYPCPPTTADSISAPRGQQPPMAYLPRAPRQLPLSRLVRKLELAGFDPILEIEREDYDWEVEAEYRGQPVKLRLDPWTGELLEYSMEDDAAENTGE